MAATLPTVRLDPVNLSGGGGRRDGSPASQEMEIEIERERGSEEGKWWQVRWCRGMVDDVRRRAPFYKSDFVDAWDYRVVPATVYMYFAK
jgi:hypothetical protein